MAEHRPRDAMIRGKESRARAAAAKPEPALRELVDSGDSDALEAALMEKLERGAAEMDFYLKLLLLLAKRKRTDEAELFLQLVVEALVERKGRESELDLVGPLLSMWPDSAFARERMLDAFRARYHAKPSLEKLLEHFQVTTSDEPIATLEKVEGFLRYDGDSVVYSPAFGVGRVTELNLTLGTIKVRFQDKGSKLESFRIGEAHRLLQPLPEGHFLRDKLEKPEELKRIASEDPGELLRRLFSSESRAMTSSELKQMLSDIVPSGSWSSWWNRARQDTRLTVGTGSRPTCTWADSAEQADEAIAGEFERAAPRDKVALAVKHAGRSSKLTQIMREGLERTAETVREKERSLNLELLLAAERLGAPASPAMSVLEDGELEYAVMGVDDRNLRRRGIALVREAVSGPEWIDAYVGMLKNESDAQSIALMYESLRKDTEGGELDTLIGHVLNAPSSAPALYLWLVREMKARPELLAKADWRFLQGLLGALGDQEMRSHHATLRKAFDAGGVVDEVIKGLEADQARELLGILDKGPNLEDYRRDSMRGFLMDRHGYLREDKEEVLLTTAEALEAKREDFQKLITQDIPQNTQDMMKAKAHGDLRENFEYHAARARQEMLSSRAKTLHDQLNIARTIEPATVDTSAVSIGSRVTLNTIGNGGDRLTLTILGPWDSDPTQHVVSYLAPAVASLMGARPGQKVEYDGHSYTVGTIEVWTAKESHDCDRLRR